MPAAMTVVMNLHCDCGACLKYDWNRWSGAHASFQGEHMEGVMREISQAGWSKQGNLWIGPECQAQEAK